MIKAFLTILPFIFIQQFKAASTSQFVRNQAEAFASISDDEEESYRPHHFDQRPSDDTAEPATRDFVLGGVFALTVGKENQWVVRDLALRDDQSVTVLDSDWFNEVDSMSYSSSSDSASESSDSSYHRSIDESAADEDNASVLMVRKSSGRRGHIEVIAMSDEDSVYVYHRVAPPARQRLDSSMMRNFHEFFGTMFESGGTAGLIPVQHRFEGFFDSYASESLVPVFEAMNLQSMSHPIFKHVEGIDGFVVKGAAAVTKLDPFECTEISTGSIIAFIKDRKVRWMKISVIPPDVFIGFDDRLGRLLQVASHLGFSVPLPAEVHPVSRTTQRPAAAVAPDFSEPDTMGSSSTTESVISEVNPVELKTPKRPSLLVQHKAALAAPLLPSSQPETLPELLQNDTESTDDDSRLPPKKRRKWLTNQQPAPVAVLGPTVPMKKRAAQSSPWERNGKRVRHPRQPTLIEAYKRKELCEEMVEVFPVQKRQRVPSDIDRSPEAEQEQHQATTSTERAMRVFSAEPQDRSIFYNQVDRFFLDRIMDDSIPPLRSRSPFVFLEWQPQLDEVKRGFYFPEPHEAEEARDILKIARVFENLANGRITFDHFDDRAAHDESAAAETSLYSCAAAEESPTLREASAASAPSESDEELAGLVRLPGRRFVSISDYVLWASHILPCDYRCLLVSFVYMKRLRRFVEFNAETAHQLVGIVMQLSVKVNSDFAHLLAFFSAALGIPEPLLKTLESKILSSLEWKVWVKDEELDKYQKIIGQFEF